MHTINPKFKHKQDIRTAIDTDKKMVLIHIPKTGGTSIRAALGLEGFGSHAKWHHFARVMGAEYDQYFSFCFVRNPWSRFLSFYNYVRKKESYYHSAINPSEAIYGKHRHHDLLSKSTLNQAVHHLVEGRLRPYRGQFFLMDPQSKWCYNDKNRCRVSFVGKFESINQDFTMMCKQARIEPAALPTLNSSSDKLDYREHYDAESRHLLGQYYERDIDLFKYTF